MDISNQTSDTTQRLLQSAAMFGGPNGMHSMLLSNPYFAQLTQSAAPQQGSAPQLQRQPSQSAFVRHSSAHTSGHGGPLPGGALAATCDTPSTAVGAVTAPAMEAETGKGAVDAEAGAAHDASIERVRPALFAWQAWLCNATVSARLSGQW